MTQARNKLFDEIEASAVGPARGCTMVGVLAEMDDDDRRALLLALADDRYQGSQIARALRGRGIQVSNFVLRRHRRGECGCDR